ncbi:High affinity cAMP-specific 3',5'-cyclic phosphodiesterase 7A [Portunus trituberculatus]|uniref:High affinity cAMP-specific 3',5'-cyclic phosphodiesterase 7A n=1 Tax=Portunus trituberculatus TaxID=210409 RepID=A0A5B7CKS8_PORTR|nr:High affinity cAMP-specific 3',5'-cyclic phosphodiesterase 7A [Portunus trituberculatus]
MGCLWESGLLDSWAADDVASLQDMLRSLILATDITRQQEFLTRFKLYLDRGTFDMKEPEHRHFSLQIALKCADICNPCRPWEVSKQWSYKPTEVNSTLTPDALLPEPSVTAMGGVGIGVPRLATRFVRRKEVYMHMGAEGQHHCCGRMSCWVVYEGEPRGLIITISLCVEDYASLGRVGEVVWEFLVEAVGQLAFPQSYHIITKSTTGDLEAWNCSLDYGAPLEQHFRHTTPCPTPSTGVAHCQLTSSTQGTSVCGITRGHSHFTAQAQRFRLSPIILPASSANPHSHFTFTSCL